MAADAVHMVHAGWTRNIIGLATEAGANAEVLWKASGLDPGRLGDEVLEVAHLRVWAAIMDCLQRPGFPIHVATTRTINDYALLGLACKTSRTVGDALKQFIRYLPIWNNQYRLEVVEHDDYADLILRGPTGDLARRCTNESAVAQILKAVRDTTQLEVCPVSVSFRHPQPDDITEHRSFFDCPIEFSAQFDGLALSRATLETELVLADDALSSFFLTELDSLLAKHAGGEPLTEKVRRAAGQLLPGGAPKLDEVAAALGMSARTLQRELAVLDTNFAQLVDTTRHQLAVELLGETELAVSEIAFALGFSESSAFHRAFKRWTGTTPKAFRAR